MEHSIGNSFVSLVNELCDHYIDSAEQEYRFRVHANLNEKIFRKQLRKTAYNAIFSHLFSIKLRESSSTRPDVISPEYENILLAVVELRRSGQFEKADRLQSLFTTLRRNEEKNNNIRPMLKLLTALKGSEKDEEVKYLGEDAYKLSHPMNTRSSIEKQIDKESDLPQHYGVALSYEATIYPHYPRELFEQPFAQISSITEDYFSSVCVSDPGLGISEILQQTSSESELEMKLTQNNLFHLPELPDQPEFRVPKFKDRKSDSRLSLESGLGSTNSLTDSTSALVLDEDCPWLKAVREKRCKRDTWERRGLVAMATEKPYLTEAGQEVLDLVIASKLRHLSHISGQRETLCVITADTLVKHILFMLLGSPSETFYMDEESMEFSLRNEYTHVSGLTPQSLTNYLTVFMECGTHYKRLFTFSQPSSPENGLVFQAFTHAIRTILTYFYALVLEIPASITLFQLKVALSKLMAQIRYVAALCHCADKPPPSQPPASVPTGISLLTYIYNEAQLSSVSTHYNLLLYILQASFVPLSLFIKEWIFYGIYRDNYNEFFIRNDPNSILNKDESYWLHAYTAVEERDTHPSLPECFQQLIHHIVTCGKSINLLRVCDNQHYLCNVPEKDIPRISISLSKSDLEVTELSCRLFVGRMKQAGRQQTINREDVLAKIEQDRKELIEKAREITDQRLESIQSAINERKRKNDEKKKQELSRLKEQMVADLKRRRGEVVKEKEEGRKYIARVNREEDQLSEKEIELEKKARDDLIAYYTELGEEAMKRERLALWKIRRARLETSRLDFLLNDQDKWKEEMEEHTQAKKLLDNSHSRLPTWVQKFSNKEPIETEQLPEKGFNTSPISSNGFRSETRQEPEDEAQQQEKNKERITTEIPNKTDDNLPNWAKSRVSNPSTLVVTEEDDHEDTKVANFSQKLTRIPSQNLEVDNNGAKFSNENFAIVGFKEAFDKIMGEFYAVKKNTSEFDFKKQILPHVSEESRQNQEHICVKKIAGQSINNETEEVEEIKSGIKIIDGVNSTTESKEEIQKVHIKVSKDMYSTKESQTTMEDQKPHLKKTAISVNQETSEEFDPIPKRRENNLQATSESEPIEWIIKKPSVFGHVSQLSQYVSQIPKIKPQAIHVNTQSFDKDFSIKPRIRMNQVRGATKESSEDSSSAYRAHIKTFSDKSSTLQSIIKDETLIKIDRFRLRNTKGHASDSTIQHLLYYDKEEETKVIELEPIKESEIIPGPDYIPTDYAAEVTAFKFNGEIQTNLMSKKVVLDLDKILLDTSIVGETENEETVELNKLTPISVLLNKSLAIPVRTQISLVNDAVINYFTNELRMDEHFVAIRRYLLMADGDFAEILANLLMDKFFSRPRQILNSVFLNGILHKSIHSSIHSNDKLTQNLSFRLKYEPKVFSQNDPKSLNCLDLCYIVKWPLNIILTEEYMAKYSLVFGFLMQIKCIVWALKDVWYRLKKDVLINKVGNSLQFRKLQGYRQEMEHFVKIMQGYISTQVIHVCWQEFQSSLSQPLAGLDRLRSIHQHYVKQLEAKCLLHKKAEKVMKIIQDTFILILKFRSQLMASRWQASDVSGELTLPNFQKITEVYNNFHDYSAFLFKVLHRMSQKGYQPHLQDLVLQLNFNQFYSKDQAT